MSGCLRIDAPVEKKGENAMERRPFVLYLLIGEIPIGEESMEASSGISGMRKKRLISSILVLEFICVEIKEEDSNS